MVIIIIYILTYSVSKIWAMCLCSDLSCTLSNAMESIALASEILPARNVDKVLRYN